MPKAIKTFFSKSAMPKNLLTEAQFKKFGMVAFQFPDHSLTAELAAKKYAMSNEGALLLKDNGELHVFTVVENKGFPWPKRSIYLPGEWQWIFTQSDDETAYQYQTGYDCDPDEMDRLRDAPPAKI